MSKIIVWWKRAGHLVYLTETNFITDLEDFLLPYRVHYYVFTDTKGGVIDEKTLKNLLERARRKANKSISKIHRSASQRNKKAEIDMEK